MKFLVDAQLPPVLCAWLGDHGHEALHVTRIGLGAASDAAIASYAEDEGATLISKDEDFVVLRLPDRFGLLWLRCGQCHQPRADRLADSPMASNHDAARPRRTFHRGDLDAVG